MFKPNELTQPKQTLAAVERLDAHTRYPIGTISDPGTVPITATEGAGLQQVVQ
jgi:hypothetical protein